MNIDEQLITLRGRCPFLYVTTLYRNRKNMASNLDICIATASCAGKTQISANGNTCKNADREVNQEI